MRTKKLLIAPLLSIVFAAYTAGYGQSTDQNPVNNTVTPATNSGDAFGKGSNVFNLGVGIGGFYTYWGSGYTETPNFVLSYDNGTFGHVGPGTISLGALLSYKGIYDNYSYPNYYYHQTWNYWILGIRSAYHWNFTHNSKCDPYAGIMFAYYMVNYRLTTNNPNFDVPGNPYYYIYNQSYSSYYALSAYLGFRYFVSNNIGIWGELGYGYTTLAVGASFKF